MLTRFLVGFIALATTACSQQIYSAEKTCGGRLPNWLAPSAGIADLAILQPVTVTKADLIHWNGKEISQDTFDRYLHLVKEMDPQPQVVLRAENGANCAAVRAARAKIDKVLECQKWGYCGEGTGWRRWPGAKPEA